MMVHLRIESQKRIDEDIQFDKVFDMVDDSAG